MDRVSDACFTRSSRKPIIVVAAYRNGLPDKEITRHRSPASMRTHVRRAKLSGRTRLAESWCGRTRR